MLNRMFRIYFGTSLILSAILAGILLSYLIDPIPLPITLPNSAYAQVSGTNTNSSSIAPTFPASENSSSNIKINDMLAETKNNDTKIGSEISSNETFFFNNFDMDESGVFSNMINGNANFSSISNTATLGSSGVTADFNGDGYDDLAIGIPFENEGDSCTVGIPSVGVTASGNDGNLPQNVLDNNLGTRWSSQGIGQYITTDLGSTKKICSIDIAWYNGNSRQNNFVIATSNDGNVFSNEPSRISSGITLNSEKYTISPTDARYVRIIINGNTVNNWASITELDIYGPSTSQPKIDSGAVNIIYGSSGGLSSFGIDTGNGGANQIWTQAISGGLEPGDLFGSSLSAGDFNADGYSDLAIGVPGEDVGTLTEAGAVNVIYGSSSGLASEGNQIWTQNGIGYPASSAAGDLFGSALTTGDFNNDGISDLAIGSPRDDINTPYGYVLEAGAVDIIYGSSNGLNNSITQIEEWTQYTPSLDLWWNDTELNDMFGSSLASGDFNNDGYSELVIGVPGEDIGSVLDAGQVNVVYYGVSTGAGVYLQTWTQNSAGIKDVSDNDDLFSSSLTTGDFNNDGYSDVAIGVSGEAGDIVSNNNTISDAGAVNIIYGSLYGLRENGISVGNGRDDQIWTQDSPGIDDDSEEGDIFGAVLTTGDFNKDEYLDLVIGVPREDINAVTDGGAVNVIYGSSDGLSSIRISPSNGRADQIWTQDTINVEGAVESRDLFGSALTTGDFNKDGISDLAIGVPLESVNTPGYAGAVNVIYGSIRTDIPMGGLNAIVAAGTIGRADQLWTQDSPGIADYAEGGDQFGRSFG
jgi:hypothetical protein